MTDFQLQMAPIQGCTEAGYRNLFSQYFGGVDAYFTPFLRVEHGEVRRRNLRDIEPEANATPRLIPQLLASTKDEASHLLAEVLKRGYTEVDINLGCPFPMLAKHHKGSGLLPYPDEVAQLLQIVVEHPEVNFSVKMRLGYERPDECLALLPTLNALPLRQIAVHARVGVQQYKGVCNRPAFKTFAAECKHPLVYNGDLCTVADIDAVRAEFPTLAGVMLGRGLLARPWLAAEYRSGETFSPECGKEQLRRFHTELLSYYEQRLEGGEKQLLQKMKEQWTYLLPEADRKLHKQIHKAQTIAAYTQAVHRILH